MIVLHGGPGAAGSAAPVAQGLAGSCRVLEPWQRSSGEEPLTVARHVADLRTLIETECEDEPPVLLGTSWGAMLALAHAAEHPASQRALVLVGCGTFDPAARERMQATLTGRLGESPAAMKERLDAEISDPDASLAAMAAALDAVYQFDSPPAGLRGVEVDARANDETWRDMLRLQAEWVYPAAFTAIRVPVLMLHGAFDPHPGALIRDVLTPHLPQLEYREWERCGHEPWRERGVREAFFTVLEDWIRGRF